MSTPNNDSPPTDINERRRLQNRLAQKNYRTRQKMRMKLAEAVLHEMPNIHAAIAAAGTKRKNSLTGVHNNVPESVRALANFALMSGGSGEIGALPSTNHPPTLDGTPGEDLSNQLQHDNDFQVNSEMEYSVDQSMVNMNCIDPALTNFEWMSMECNSPPNTQLTSPALPTLGGGELSTSIESANSYSEQSASDRSRGGTRWQKSKSPPQGDNLGPEASTSTLALQASPSAALQNAPSIIPSLSSQNPSTSSSIIPVSSDSDEPLEDLAIRSTADLQAAGPKNPLLSAVALGNLEIARLLLCSGAKLDVADSSGKTALHRAVESGDTRSVAALLELGADILTKDSQERGLLHTAVQKNQLEVVETILEWCKDHDDLEKSTSKSIEERRGSTGARKKRASLFKRFIDAQDGKKMTAVHDCVLLGRAEILKLLLEYGADVNIGCN